MKKLSISFILLGFLALVPQSALANAPYPLNIMEKLKNKEAKINELKERYNPCLQEHKSMLPKKYKGPNLRLEFNKEINSYVVKSNHVDYWFYTDNEYFIDVDETNILKKTSLAKDCNTEYINVYSGWPNGNINVIDVPPGSHLKYIPGTDEIQVLPPTKESYKNHKNEYFVFQKLDDQIKQGLQIKKEKDLKCVNKKKTSFTAGYAGSNLKYEAILNYSENNSTESNKQKLCVETYSNSELLTMTENRYNVVSPNEYRTETSTGRRLPLFKKSYICDCEEYIFVNADNQTYIYNVTNVPSRSTLKFIPETKEIQVFPITKENLEPKIKKELKRKDKLMCIYKKKLNLPKEYKGPNLKLQTDVKGEIFETKLIYNHLYKDTRHPKLSGLQGYGYFSIISYDEEGCAEYWPIKQAASNINELSKKGIGYVNVTNVPAYSYLKFIPETNEAKVLFSENSFYNEYIKKKMQNLEDKTKKLQKSIEAENVKLMAENLEELTKAIDDFITIDWTPEKHEESNNMYKKAAEKF